MSKYKDYTGKPWEPNNPPTNEPTEPHRIAHGKLLMDQEKEMKALIQENKELKAEVEGHRAKWGGPTIYGHPFMIEQVRQNNDLYAQNKSLREALEKYADSRFWSNGLGASDYDKSYSCCGNGWEIAQTALNNMKGK